MVREEMLERLEEAYNLNITVDETGKEFEFEFYSPEGGEDYVFCLSAESDTELAHELYQNAQSFNKDEHVLEVVNMQGAPDLKTLVKDADAIEEILNTLADAARDYIRDREHLMDAVDYVKPGDTVVYTVNNQKYEGIAASAPEVNHDSDEHDVEIQFEGGGAVVVDESIAGIKPVIANHIKDSAKDFDVNEIEDGIQVLEMYVQLDALGEYAMEHMDANIRDVSPQNTYARFYQDGKAELIAEGYYGEDLDTLEVCAWTYEIPQDSKEYEILCDHVQYATGEPVQDTISRMLDTIDKVVLKLDNIEELNNVIDEKELGVTALEYAGEHCETAYAKGTRLYMEDITAGAVQDVKDMLDRNGIQYEECQKARDVLKNLEY